MMDKLRQEIEDFDERQRKLFETSVFMAKMLGAGAFHLYPTTLSEHIRFSVSSRRDNTAYY